jgi:hypothetical protein
VTKRFVSIGECMIEMSGGEGGMYKLGYAGDTLNTAWYARPAAGRLASGLCDGAGRRHVLGPDACLSR